MSEQGDPTCEVLFFGSDRYDNSGDAQQGFWFFQNKIQSANSASKRRYSRSPASTSTATCW